MTLGKDIIIATNGVAVYAKLTAMALYQLQCRKLVYAFNRYMEGKHFNLPKRANKFLRKHGIAEVVALDDAEIEVMRNGGFPPSGSLLVKYDPER